MVIVDYKLYSRDDDSKMGLVEEVDKRCRWRSE